MGPALEIAGANRVRNEQRDIMNRQVARSNATMDKTTGQILDEGQKYAPGARLADMLGQENATFDQSQKDLQGAGAGTIPTAGDAGNVSADFLRAKADRTLSEGNRMTAIARELAKVHAPGQQMQKEGLRRANVQNDVASQWGTTQNMGDAAKMDAEQVQEPWWATVARLGDKAGRMAIMGGM